MFIIPWSKRQWWGAGLGLAETESWTVFFKNASGLLLLYLWNSVFWVPFRSTFIHASTIPLPSSVSLCSVLGTLASDSPSSLLVSGRSTPCSQADFCLPFVLCCLIKTITYRDAGWLFPCLPQSEETLTAHGGLWWFSEASRLIVFILAAGYTRYKIIQLCSQSCIQSGNL